MKQILRLGGGYVLFPVKRYALYALLTSLYIILLPTGFARAQSASVKNLGIPEGGLKIGDTIPESLWHLPLQVVNHPEGKDTITLNHYRGKLIILDFWATWCVPCIRSLAKLDTLQAQFSDDVFIIPSTYEPFEKASSFFRLKRWSLPTAVSEKQLKVYFPYHSIPHQVWIKNGQVLAITYAAETTEANIRALLSGSGKPRFDLKRDIVFGYFESIEQYAVEQKSPILNRVLLTAYVRGLQGGGTRKNDSLKVIYFNNYAPLLMYRDLLKTTYNNFVIDASRREDLIPAKGKKSNRLCFQVLFPLSMPDSICSAKATKELDNCLSLKLSRQNRKTECLVIYADSKAKLPIKHLSGPTYPFATYVGLLNYTATYIPDYPVIIDESGFHGVIPKNLYLENLGLNLKKLAAILKPYGLSVRKEKRMQNKYVIADSKN